MEQTSKQVPSTTEDGKQGRAGQGRADQEVQTARFDRQAQAQAREVVQSQLNSRPSKPPASVHPNPQLCADRVVSIKSTFITRLFVAYPPARPKAT